MNESVTRWTRFRVSISSVFAGFLFFGGFEALIRLSRDPIAHGVTWLLNRFTHAMPPQTPLSDWTFFFLNLAVASIFVLVGVIVGARTLQKRSTAAR